MARLEAPAEILDFADGQPQEFRVLRFELGELWITPRGAPAGRDAVTIRMHVPPEDKPMGAPYWDATAGNLVARLKSVLPDVIKSGRRIRISKHGQAPYARHQVDFL